MATYYSNVGTCSIQYDGGTPGTYKGTCPKCGGVVVSGMGWNGTYVGFWGDSYSASSPTGNFEYISVGVNVSYFGMWFSSDYPTQMTQSRTGYYYTGTGEQSASCYDCGLSMSMSSDYTSETLYITVIFTGISGSASFSHSDISQGDTATISWSGISGEMYCTMKIYANSTLVHTSNTIYDSYYTYSGSTSWATGTSYYFQLTAITSGGGSSETFTSSTYTVVSAATIPSAPTNVLASSKEVGQGVTVTWGSVTGATQYEVRVYKNSSLLSSFVSASNSYAYTLSSSNWSAGNTYYFSIAATNAAGTSSYTNSSTYTVLATNTAPTTPSSISVSNLKAGQSAMISWGSSSDSQGDGIIYYPSYRYATTSSGVSSATWTYFAGTYSISRSYSVPAGHANYYYQFAVYASDGSLTSSTRTSNTYQVASQALMISPYVDGAYKSSSDAQCRVGGVWHAYSQISCKIDGVWKNLFY